MFQIMLDRLNKEDGEAVFYVGKEALAEKGF